MVVRDDECPICAGQRCPQCRGGLSEAGVFLRCEACRLAICRWPEPVEGGHRIRATR